MEKLYLVTRRDLEPGAQAVQSCHAMRQFVADHPEKDREWLERSNHLCFLAVKDEAALLQLVERADREGHAFSIFFEPDMGYEMTAVALEPAARRLCRGMKKALDHGDRNGLERME